MKRHLVWLRADLRCHDNTALLAACAERDTQLACLYLVTPRQWQKHDVAGVRVDFELRNLHSLRDDLAALDIPLLVAETADYAGVPKVISQLVQEHRIDAVFANRQYEINEARRDSAVAAALHSIGCQLQLFHDQCALPPGSIRKQDGGAYSVFTPFKRNWLQQLAATSSRPGPAPRARSGSFTRSSPLPEQAALVSHVSPEIATQWWPAGEKKAQQRLKKFADNLLDGYQERRDFPAQDGVSRLSPYLAAGVISPRQCLNAAFNHQARHGETAGSAQWIAEIAWRDFYKHVLVAWPQVCMHQPFRPETAAIRWRHDEADFKRWCEGRTGFPLVDAAMRQLQQTGWMHNRLRMVVAMFLTKDLFIDWRWGERFFMQHLVDGDLSANNGGWQWSASTGNDAAPYFRIFNPVSQSLKFDADGHFIREYVPELRELPSRQIHDPYAKGQTSLFMDYPEPMVDHSLARERVLQAFKGLS